MLMILGDSLMAKLESLKLGSEGSNPSPPAKDLKEIDIWDEWDISIL